ncbi:2-amino-4-hydroxy-6-hydroxymethyldihydropteridine diphosphokinase [Arthrobacter agilis]|uniref:2-amino-4-hydroxy-6- hydroxymethyldihydropteridine diphosphokinase n=1 Tax=Arthrobacter agilis TaxID=37921 RepID=UPI000B355F12|nr:2-amino-4-hydroxy-6-hydroxymethyldihydropteridine diphosphokinase [Arthrobacter agilis]OUM42384.1 2-amino-4-hydroxy-6-hydroxymethyldihydropteridine diphosphokinase [Arthrobacter agilis]PPB45725.1 2-amino-4-hydroxy-6-hydroxymethyldihydropteridine diphosphokinase [Arthrobacter agilis]TPV26294.1 2-amino-4-hydroxy-6-hydroxymethyldihydropteridine diphosphokinase [Arthrobacter agilis]WDF33459.1 2-amino-4-hydroxy-6-hydroxymethyldihydropteridine diphosphokinase [Arthrobacter agilis]VDR30853.1 2-ami
MSGTAGSAADGTARTTVRSVIALGSNLGASSDTLVLAVADLVETENVRLHAVSPVVRTKPVGGPEQPDYLNMVIEVETDLGPYDLLAHCQAVEEKHHRRRTVRWGPRTLDVDIITYGSWTSADEVLTVPHPRAASRAFVLQPWAWMDSAARLHGRPVAELAAEADDLAGLVPFEGV